MGEQREHNYRTAALTERISDGDVSARTEVTQGQFEELMGYNPSSFACFCFTG